MKELKPGAPQIAALDAEIEGLEQQIAELDVEFVESVLAAARQRLLEAQRKEEDLRAIFAMKSQEVVELNAQLVEFAILQSRYERAKSFCDILEERIRVISVDPHVASLTVEIIKAAEPATVPSEPPAQISVGPEHEDLAIEVGHGDLPGAQHDCVRYLVKHGFCVTRATLDLDMLGQLNSWQDRRVERIADRYV